MKDQVIEIWLLKNPSIGKRAVSENLPSPLFAKEE